MAWSNLNPSSCDEVDLQGNINSAQIIQLLLFFQGGNPRVQLPNKKVLKLQPCHLQNLKSKSPEARRAHAAWSLEGPANGVGSERSLFPDVSIFLDTSHPARPWQPWLHSACPVLRLPCSGRTGPRGIRALSGLMRRKTKCLKIVGIFQTLSQLVPCELLDRHLSPAPAELQSVLSAAFGHSDRGPPHNANQNTPGVAKASRIAFGFGCAFPAPW